MNLPGLPIFISQVIVIDERPSNELLYPYNPPTYDLLKIFFSFPFILISEFGVIQSWSQIPREDFANTQVPYRPTENVRVHINLAARAREERFIPDAGISCSTNTWNVAALCYSVFVVQFVPQERLMCSCMITRLCMQSQTNTFESYHSILVCIYMYMLVLHQCPISDVLLRRGPKEKLLQGGATSRQIRWAYHPYHGHFIWDVQTFVVTNHLELLIQVTNSWWWAD